MRTEIATLGEFGLIRHLTKGIELQNKSTLYGVGDDAAVLSYPADKEILVTTDLLLEGVHFDLTYVPLKHLGYKSAVVNFSDIYAMNGTPRQITVSLGISKRFCFFYMEALYAGIRLACEEYGVDIAGGKRESRLSERSQRDGPHLRKRRFRCRLHGASTFGTRESCPPWKRRGNAT